jgi:hypothetical protein
MSKNEIELSLSTQNYEKLQNLVEREQKLDNKSKSYEERLYSFLYEKNIPRKLSGTYSVIAKHLLETSFFRDLEKEQDVPLFISESTYHYFIVYAYVHCFRSLHQALIFLLIEWENQILIKENKQHAEEIDVEIKDLQLEEGINQK